MCLVKKAKERNLSYVLKVKLQDNPAAYFITFFLFISKMLYSLLTVFSYFLAKV